MQYATLGKTGLKVSRLGFGAMRLPMLGANVDRDKAIPMIHRAFELGVNYIDSAVFYCNGDSQRAVGDALKSWPKRSEIIVSTKNSHYNRRKDRPWWQNLEDSLERLAVEAIDVYHFHGLRGETFDEHLAGRGGQLEWMRKAVDQGLVRNVAFSFHGMPQDLERFAKSAEFSVVTLQYNLLDRSNEALLPLLHKCGLGVVVMGPVGGGRLGTPSEALKGMVSGARSVPEVALRFVLANPNVTVALSGMSEMSHFEENARIAGRDTALSAVEKRRVKSALDRFKKLADLYCTGCNYCMPCPSGVDIPKNFSALNYERVYQLPKVARDRYSHMEGKASQCLACGKCVSKCPQNIDIISQLRQTVRTLDEAYGKLLCTITPGEIKGLSLRGGRCDAQLQCRLEVRNLSDQDAAPTLDFKPAKGVTVEVAKSLEPIGAFGRKSALLNVTAKGAGDLSALPLALSVNGGREAVVAGDPLQLGLALRGGKSPAIKAANLRHDTHATPAQRKSNWATAKLAYDAKDLIIQIEAAGKFAAKGKPNGRSKPGQAWIGVTSKTPATSSTLHDQGLLLTVDLGGATGDSLPVQVHSHIKLPKGVKLTCRVSGTAARRKGVVRLPWKLLGLKAKAGLKLSLDFGMMFAGAREPWGVCWGARRSVKPVVILG